MKALTAEKDASFIETPTGIFTAAGNWFNTTEEALHAYAGPVLEYKTISELLQIAELWMRSPVTLVLWTTPFMLWKLGVIPTLIGCIVLFILLGAWAPVVVSLNISPALRILDHVLVQAVLYVTAMSWFAMEAQYSLMATGLTVFIMMRWGIIARLFQPWIQKIRNRMYRVPFADQVLKSVIVRAALKHRIALPEIDRMERFIMNRISGK